MASQSPPSKHNTSCRIRQVLRLKDQARRPLCLTVWELEVVICQNVHHDRLDFGRCEEPTRARVPPVAKRHARRMSGSKGVGSLRLSSLNVVARARLLGHLVETESLESFGLGEQLGIHGDGVGGHADSSVRGDPQAVR